MNKIKTFFLVAAVTFSTTAFSQDGIDFKPKEIYEMLGMNPDYCIKQLKTKGYEYSYSDGDANLYTANGNAIILNYAAGERAVNIIVYSTLDYAFVSSLRVFLLVGFYSGADVDDAQTWDNQKGTTKIFLTETTTKEDEAQYNIAFKNVR